MARGSRWEGAKYALGYLASIGVFMVFLVVVLPFLFGALPNVVVSILAMALVAPAVGAIIMALQGEIDWRPRTLWSVYLRDTVALFIELLFIVLIIPVLALQLAMVLGGVLGVALLVGLIGFAIQETTSINLKIGIGWADAIGYAKYLVLILLGEAVLVGVFFWLKGKEDSALDAYIELRERIMDKLRPHARQDPRERRKRQRERRSRQRERCSRQVEERDR